MRDNRLYLIHIRDTIDRIRRFTKGGKKEFLHSELIREATLHCLQTLTESTQRLSSDFKILYPEIDWQGMAGFRNVLVHGYLAVDYSRVWQIIKKDLADLKRRLLPIFRSLPKDPGVEAPKPAKKRSRKRKS